MPNDLTTPAKTSPLALLSSHSRQEISAALSTPVDQAKLFQAIKDLLGMYWIAADMPEDRARQIALFVKDLAKFPDAVVAYAVHDWRTRQDRRPSIASLHQLCMTRQVALIQRRDALFEAEQGQSSAPEPTPEEMARREEFMARALDTAGFAKRKAGWLMKTEIAEAEDKPRIPHWSETAAPNDPRFAALRKARADAGVFLPDPGGAA